MDTLPVIVAVDGSPDSERALRWAIEAARLRSAPLQIVHVWPYVTTEGRAAAESGIGDPVLDELRKKLDGQAGTAGLPGVEFRSLSGLTDTLLPALGAEAQLLVLGSRGRGGFASLLLGSNGMACAAHSEGPVVVVPARTAATRNGARTASWSAPPRRRSRWAWTPLPTSPARSASPSPRRAAATRACWWSPASPGR